MDDSLNSILSINLLDYAYQRGYTKLLNGKESATWVSLKNPSTGDHIRIKTRSNPMLYNNNDLNLGQDRGNIINFVINRFDDSITTNTKPSKVDFSRAFSLLKAYRGDIQVQSNFEISREKNFDIEKFVKIKIENLRNCTIQSKDYLRNVRQIDPEIIENPIFLNKIKESPVSSTEPNALANICFVKTKLDNTITGIVTHYHNTKDKVNVKRVYEESDNIWVSNMVNEPKNLIYGESAIDCLSHYELFRAKSSCYASFEGQTSEEKLLSLYKVYESLGKESTITSITDNDYNGNNYDLETAIYFYNKNNEEPIIKETQNESVNYKFKNGLKGVNVSEIFDKMAFILKLEAPSSSNIFLKVLRVEVKGEETVLTLPFKYKDQKVSHFLKPFTQAIHISNGVRFFNHKSKSKDWNEDLQQKKKQHQNERKHDL